MAGARKIWRLPPHDPETVQRYARAAGVSPTVAMLLLNRRVTDPAHAQKFLDAPLIDLHPPQLLPDVPGAAALILNAVERKQSIVVYGDYDADGVTGTAILLQLFQHLGATASYYVPHRLEEGYGLNCDALTQLKQTGADLVISVDCGIASLAEAEHARSLGLSLIITDHHEMKWNDDRSAPILPNAAVLVHPRLPGSAYPFDGLSGAGVAFKLAWEIAQRVSGASRVTPALRDYLLDATGLAALGLVADVMPLRDENRILVRRGLGHLASKPSVGLKALIVAAKLSENGIIRAEDVAFRIAPRLNAVGRLGCARLVVELLTTKNPDRAKELAEFLEGQNLQRQSLEKKIAAQAREMIRDQSEEPAIVLASPEWHAGVVGIVAGRLCEQFAKPVILLSIGELVAGGSGRSIPGCPLHELLDTCKDELLSHGGHAAAAGLKLRPDRIDAFRDRFMAAVSERLPDGPPAPTLNLDGEVPLSALTLGLLKDIEKLEPYGADNPRPRFLASNLLIENPKKIGQNERHLSFRCRQGGTTLRAVAFGRGDDLDDLMSAGGTCCLAFTPKKNEWNGRTSVELEVIDYRPGIDPGLG